jgi:hypothetical protein
MPLFAPVSVQHPGAPAPRGFALLVTIVLVAFLVLILVGLASFTRVETQVADNSRVQNQARQNALMALSVAIGELQRQTGPDQRVTATADLAAPSAASPRWVGAYGNAAAADYTQTPSAITPAQPRLLNWLVSGNEGLPLAADAGGRITSATPAFALTPASPVTMDGGGALASATASSVLRIGSAEARLLVGPGSVNPARAATDFVAAPWVPLRATAGTVPGISPTDTPVVGGYAWWVGDEGVKARVNLRDSYLLQATPADQDAFRRYSFITAQRSAVEFVEHLAATPLGADFPFDHAGVSRVVALNQLPFVGPTATARDNLSAAAINRFHDLGAHSRGVLADAYAGGLKKDLTADLAGAADRPADTDPIFPRLNNADLVPTWGQLRGYASATGATRDPALPSGTSPGIYPVITMAALGLDFFLDAGGALQTALYPYVVLWNPHSATINPADYEIGYRMHDDGLYAYEINPAATGGTFTTRDTLDLAAGQWSSVAATGNNYVTFRVDAPALAPGESLVFALAANGQPYTPGGNTLAPADAALDNLLNYAAWTSPALSTIPAATLATGRVRVRGDNPSTNNQSFEIVLARPGGISTFGNTAGWYQAVLDTRPGRLGAVSGGRITLLPDSTFASLPLESSAATNTLRAQMVMESRGGWNGNVSRIGPLGTGRIRWLVTGDPRAPVIRNTEIENTATSPSGANRGNALFGAQIQLYDYDSTTRDRHFPLLGYTHGNRLSAGRGQETSAAKYSPAVLFNHLESADHFLSLGQLQHGLHGRFGFYSTYPFGNAWADVRIARDQQYRANTFAAISGAAATQTLYDLSWHLNRALWDRTFVSGVPSTWTAADLEANRALPNARLTPLLRDGNPPALADLRQTSPSDPAYHRAAANLLVEGAFNVNSTSEQAWRALLAATFGLPADTDYAASSENVSTLAPVPRFTGNLDQAGFTATMGVGTAANAEPADYFGNCGLLLPVNGSAPASLDATVSELARTIVVEVRARGPFLSLGDFVNRSLALDATGIRGALQAAIDNMTAAHANPDAWTSTGAALNAADKPVAGWDTEHYLGAPASGGHSTRFAAAPKFLTQADLLSLLGPALSARSDTFRIRTCGEVVNPVTNETTGRAWCEAVVQRMPDFINPDADSPETALNALADAANRTHGRRYQVVSFRWLNASDL